MTFRKLIIKHLNTALTLKNNKKNLYKIYYFIFQKTRILKYKIISDCKTIGYKPIIIQPVLFSGKGKIVINKNVNLGYNPSPFLYTGYIYIESRNTVSEIIIGKNVCINNNAVIISEGNGITIGANCLFGTNIEIYDSDFHDLDPSNRMNGTPKSKKVVIGNNVFVGSNVKILKGVLIGNNSIIAHSSVVTKDIPDNVIAGGNPCKIIKKL